MGNFYPSGMETLTPRELEIVELLADEVPSNRQIGERLGLGEETVKSHLSHAMDKLGCRNRAGVVEIVMSSRMRSRIAALEVEIGRLTAHIQLLERAARHGGSGRRAA